MAFSMDYAPIQHRGIRQLMPNRGFALSTLSMLIASCGLSPVAWSATGAGVAASGGNTFVFDSRFLAGETGHVDLSSFQKSNPVLAGNYRVDLYMNQRWIGREDIRFRAEKDQTIAVPCFTIAQLQRYGVDTSKLDSSLALGADECRPITFFMPQASHDFDGSDLRLDLSVPQAMVSRSARGYVDPRYWDHGVTAATLGYNFNTYQTQMNGKDQTLSYLGLNSGFNLGEWQFRHNSSISKFTDSATKWQNIATYAQYNSAALRSRFILGDSNTSGEVFDTLAFRGIQLVSDDRMLPDSLRGYAPVVRGVADTNALVEIRQNGFLIYQSTVAAGPFEIKDLYATGYGGDLNVTVTEADGRQRTFVVPFASVARLLRPGTSRYELTSGQYRDDQLSSKPYFLQGSYQYGLSNLTTVYGGANVSEGYTSLILGGALNTAVGAFALDVTQANTDFKNLKNYSGQSLKLGYSKRFTETDTNIAVAAYRYSTSEFLNLHDAIYMRDFDSRGLMTGGVERQKNNFEVTINQTIGKSGSFYATGSVRNYWDRTGTNTQYQVGYNNNYASMSYGFSAARTRDVLGRDDTQYMLNVSFPLGNGAYAPSVNTTMSNSTQGGTTSRVGLNGSYGEDRNLSYGVSVNNSSRNDDTSGSVTGQYLSPYSTLTGSYTEGGNYRTLSAGASGGIILHQGGLTFGPQSGETMAIVEAQSAKGARVANYSGVRIDGRGYALIPYLIPYSNNTVEIDPKGISTDVQLESSSQQVAPYAGAVVKVGFKTTVGRSMLLRVKSASDTALPFGASVFDADGQNVGIVGQSGQLFARLNQDVGTLLIKWGEQKNQQCKINYKLPQRTAKDTGAQYELLDVQCVDSALTSPNSLVSAQ
ncbi:fimbria/pilus outer membrane usher protein [Aquirhabdus sp.]|uniref:fimbria/pilus outer membrane usher protein n=1 Tax=Aquirhabdus sp. TaxID=2824160 RepID=UPI00396C87BE